MENKKCVAFQLTYLLGFIFLFNLSVAVLADESETDMQTYIVWVRKPAESTFSALNSGDLQSWYHTFLPESSQTTTSAASNQWRSTRMVHTYSNVATGFAARLTPEEVKEMEKKDGFLYARPDRLLPLHTTHSPKFLGLQQGFGLWKGTNYGKGVIIGVLDSGISPDHPSFSDEGVPPPPAKWKGKCEFNGTVCNNKLIGARNFQGGRQTEVPPFDTTGHGTHTASTAAGNFVKGANVFGMANGTASGIAPYAHLAIYRVCTERGCADSDILAAFDTGVDDGVDVISVSIGGPYEPFDQEAIAVGAFGAIQKGIFVSCSAGNDGPFYSSISNEAPWYLTVGASTIDRKITSAAQFGSIPQILGESLFDPKNFSTSPLVPLVYSGTIRNSQTEFCTSGSLANVEGKVVVCEKGGNVTRVGKGKEVKRAGGVAMILVNRRIDGVTTTADAHVLPATNVDFSAGLKIKSYINSTTTPVATILPPHTVIGDAVAPMVASFSSKGPNIASPGILKPDIIGPGVNILAAWYVSVDNAMSPATFNMIQGTSMSCPHLSGVAALIKSSHPDWSPAAIKSAIMTTADQLNLQGTQIIDSYASPADIFSTGSGHVNPSKANDPGLIYDTEPQDYIPYLCGLNYTDREIEIITRLIVNCSEVGVTPEAQLNYPSFSIVIGSYQTQNYTRTVTNVGPANSTYNLELLVPHKLGVSVNISVSPSVLTFTQVKETITYSVEFSTQEAGQDGSFTQGYLKWVSDKYSVYTPIAVIFQS